VALYLVSGGAGFIGSNLAWELLRLGERVRVLDSFATAPESNLAPLRRDIELIRADIRDLEACRKATRGADFVLHQAALGSVPRSIDDPLTTDAVNTQGTLNLLLAAKEAGVRRFVFASSSSIYGDQPLPPGGGPSPKVETMFPRPMSPYAVSKLAAESYCKVFWRCYALPTVCLRYFNIFGPRQDPASQYAAVVPKFAAALLEGTRPVIFGDGGQSRDFTYVANAVSANLAACQAPEAAFGEAFNVGCGTSFSVRTLLSTLEEISGRKSQPDFQPPRAGDVRDSLADIDKARRLLGYEPKVGFEEGMKMTWEWYRASSV
jgi:nucleoside-diphosphate-sugar epimerase